jgi:DNA polymerase III epsilon subunit-like protein
MYRIFFDLETGGVLPQHPNIQLAAIAVDREWKEIDHFNERIRFNVADCDPEALKMNHYDPETWKDALSEREVAGDFADWLHPFRCVQKISNRTGNPYMVAPLFGHNAASFDAPRLRQMFASYGLFLAADMYVRDTMHLALWHFERRGEHPQTLRLAELCKAFGIEMGESHDALADTRACMSLAKVLLA